MVWTVKRFKQEGVAVIRTVELPKMTTEQEEKLLRKDMLALRSANAKRPEDWIITGGHPPKNQRYDRVISERAKCICYVKPIGDAFGDKIAFNTLDAAKGEAGRSSRKPEIEYVLVMRDGATLCKYVNGAKSRF